MRSESVHRWRGNGYLPGHFGRWGFNGLVVVELAGSQVTVRVRPKLVGRLLGVLPLSAEPGSGLTITGEQSRLGFSGIIRFKLTNRQEYTYISTPGRKDKVLSCLAEAGFEVSNSENG